MIAQNDVPQHPPLVPPDACMSYWPTAQVLTTADPSVSTALPMEPMQYPASCYANQDLSPTHCHTATDHHFQHGLPGGTYGTTTNLIYTESDTPTTAPALAAPAPHRTIAQEQAASGHDLIQWDAVEARSALYEVSTLRHLG